MMDKTHFADDETLARISELETKLAEVTAEREKYKEAVMEIATSATETNKKLRKGIPELIERAETAERRVRELEGEKDGAYLERNQCVAALTKLFPSTRTKTAIPGWSEDWHGCVYIQLPTGQVSWHFHDSHSRLFKHVAEAPTQWDGHDTPEKYRRLAALSEGSAK